MGRRRKLTQEECELWERVARGTRRIRPPSMQETPADTSLRQTVARPPDTGPPMTEAPKAGLLSETSLQAVTTVHKPLVGRSVLAQPLTEPLRMDHRLHGRMVRGKLVPEAKLDLHGMTLAQAHTTLNGFILGAVRRGLRLVLVITGKGKGSGQGHLAENGPVPQRPGALRHEVPHWLYSAPLKPHVLNTHPAHRSHGGDGALYVYLRKPG